MSQVTSLCETSIKGNLFFEIAECYEEGGRLTRDLVREEAQ